MNDAGEIRDDIKIPDSDIGKDIRGKHAEGSEIMVTVVSAVGEEMAVGTKPLNQK